MVYCGFSSAHAQDRLKKQDSLKKLLAVQHNDTNKVNLLNNIANTVRGYRATDKRDISREALISPRGNGPHLDSIVDSGLSPSGLTLKNELLDAVQVAMQKLPQHYQDVIHWRNHERESFEVIGKRLQRSTEAARKLWIRALELLQQELSLGYDASTSGSGGTVR